MEKFEVGDIVIANSRSMAYNRIGTVIGITPERNLIVQFNGFEGSLSTLKINNVIYPPRSGVWSTNSKYVSHFSSGSPDEEL